jgi:transcriptional regulator GlxA family with amidase domain
MRPFGAGGATGAVEFREDIMRDSASMIWSEPTGSAAAATETLADLVFLRAPPPNRGGLPPGALRRVRDYVEAHLEDNIDIQALADAAGLSMYHFARAFKQSEGVTPHEYLVLRRVHRARDLLTSTDLPLAEIARACGFSDQSHCARRFREHFGVTPSRYRWSMR